MFENKEIHILIKYGNIGGTRAVFENYLF